MLRRLINRLGYRVTMLDKQPFGVVEVRFLESKNIIGRIDSYVRKLLSRIFE